MLGRRSREFPSHHTEAALAAKATDLDALRTAVVDAAGVGYGLWFSYLFVLLYFAIAAGAVTHRDLLLESPVKLPFLNVALPLKAFFILGPLVFLVVHAYVLLHFLLLAGKVGAFHVELRKQIPEYEKRAQLRRQLPSNIFVQFLGGPREVREGVVGLLLKSIAGISLIGGPIALLILFQLQFLAYHSPWITWWQRVAIVLDLILLWLLWPPITRGDTAFLTWNDLRRLRVAVWLPVSLLPLLLVFTIATFPGEPTVRFVPTSWKAWRSPTVGATQKDGSGWATLHEILVAGKVDFVTPLQEILVAGEVDFVTHQPKSLWSNRLVLPDFAIDDRLKFDSENKISISSETVSLRGRRLEGAVLVGAHLRKADFTGSQLVDAKLTFADLREARFECESDEQRKQIKCAQLQGADLGGAHLQGAALGGAQLQGADLSLAQLQGAALGGAQLQGADLSLAQLQGAALRDAQLQGAFLRDVFVWRTHPPTKEYLKGALIEKPTPEPKYRGLDCGSGEGEVCDWKDTSYAALRASFEAVSAGQTRAAALKRVELLGKELYEVDSMSAKEWHDLAAESQRSAETYPRELAKLLIGIGCVAERGYVIDGLINSLYLHRFRFPDNPVEKAEIADAFLKKENCPGARGLSEQNRTVLRQMLTSDPRLP